jgi:DNA-binding NtrC family response regulator
MNTECAYQHNSTVGSEDPFTADPKPDTARVNGVLEGWLRPGWLSKVHRDSTPIAVLMVYGERSPLRNLTEVLSQQFSAEITHARNCQEARIVLEQSALPHILFTDTKLSDGSWEDVLGMAKTASQAVNAFVVSLVGNIVLYTEAMTRGAFDFITPNIPPAAFSEVLRSALEDVISRRSIRRAA